MSAQPQQRLLTRSSLRLKHPLAPPRAGFVNVDSEKMSKSLGNFFTIRDVVARYHPAALRWFLVNTQYRQPINYTQRALEEVGGAASLGHSV